MSSRLCRAPSIGARPGWRCIVLLMVLSGAGGRALAADLATPSHAYSGSRFDYVVRRGDTIPPVSIYGFHSHGCIRLHPDAAERLYGQVSLGETVIIVYEPALIARFADGRIHVEVHRDAYRKNADTLATLKRMADEQGLAPWIDWRKVQAAVSEKAGAMRDVTRRPLPMNGSGK